MAQSHPPPLVTVIVTFILLAVYIGTCASSSLSIDDTGRQAHIQDDGLQQGQGGSNSIHQDCGGIVTVGSEGNSTIAYGAPYVGGTYGMNERCLWTIVPEPGYGPYSYILFVEHQDMEADKDGLIFYTWAGTLQSKKILSTETGSIFTFNTQDAFLYFSSNEAVSGSGFRVSIIGVAGGTPVPTRQAFFHRLDTECPANIFYPPFTSTSYNANERLSIALQPNLARNPLTNLRMDFYQSDSYTDYLDVYRLLPYDSSTSLTLVGRYSGDVNPVTTTDIADPLLLLFSSNYFNQARGFRFTWFPSPPAM